MILNGVSTSQLKDKLDLDALLVFDPKVIEFYNYKSDEIESIEKFCKKHSIIPALHVPTPYDGEKLSRFCPSGPDLDEKLNAINITKSTIACAAKLNALHVVVHFPTPYMPHYPVSDSDIHGFFASVSDFARKYKVKVLIENLSANPNFFSPADYLKVFKFYPYLGMCLDVGHAHMLMPDYSVYDFIEVLGHFIYSVHMYNTLDKNAEGNGHYVITAGQDKNSGWIDIPFLLNQIRERTSAKALILEYNYLSPESRDKAAEDWQTINCERY